MRKTEKIQMEPLDGTANTNSTRVYDRLIHAVTTGVFQPGDRLHINDIANLLGVSITPVREALERLQSHGVAEHKPYRGFFVRQFSTREIRDIYHTRSALEGYAVRLATEHLGDAEHTKLEELQARGADLVSQNDMSGYSKYNEALHDRILQMSQNHVLYEIASNIKLRVTMLASRSIQIPGRPNRAFQEHQAIVDAMFRRAPMEAAERMERHILDAMDEVIERLPN